MAQALFVIGGLLLGAGVVGVTIWFWPAGALLLGALLCGVAADLQRGDET